MQFLTDRLENFHGEKGDLALVVFLVIEKAVAMNAPARHAKGFFHFNGRVRCRFLSIMAKIIMRGRDEDMLDSGGERKVHRGNFHGVRFN